MEDSALAYEMLKCTGMLFFGMKRGHKPMKSILHGEMFILDFLERSAGPVMPGELSAGMEASSARTAIALRNLERDGCIRRDIDENDRRKILVTITDEGRKIVRRQHEDMLNRMNLIVSELGESDTREYIRIVGRIIEITRKLMEP